MASTSPFNSLPMDVFERVLKLAAPQIWPDDSNDPVSCSIFSSSFKILVEHVASQAALLPLLGVCRRWYEVGRPLFYAWVVVRRDWDEETWRKLVKTLEGESANRSAGNYVRRLSIFPSSTFMPDDSIICDTSVELMSRLLASCSNIVGVHPEIGPASPWFDTNISRMLKPRTLQSISISIDCSGSDDALWVNDAYREPIIDHSQLRAISLWSNDCAAHKHKIETRANHPPMSSGSFKSAGAVRALTMTVSAPVVDFICRIPDRFQGLEQLKLYRLERDTAMLSGHLRRIAGAVGTSLVSLRIESLNDHDNTNALLVDMIAVCPKLEELAWYAADDMARDKTVVQAIAKRNKAGRMQPILRIGLDGIRCLTTGYIETSKKRTAAIFELLSTLANIDHVEEIILLEEWESSSEDYWSWMQDRMVNGDIDEGDHFVVIQNFFRLRGEGSISFPEDPRSSQLMKMDKHGRELMPGRELANRLIHLSMRTGVSILDCDGQALSKHAIYTDEGVARYQMRVKALEAAMRPPWEEDEHVSRKARGRSRRPRV